MSGDYPMTEYPVKVRVMHICFSAASQKMVEVMLQGWVNAKRSPKQGTQNKVCERPNREYLLLTLLSVS